MRRRPVSLIVVFSCAAGLGVTVDGSAAVPTGGGQPPAGVSWQSSGDSYSSGEGVAGNQGDCAQSPAAYGPATAVELVARGWEITNETFTACTGHLVEDMFNGRGAGAGLWSWGLEQGGPDRVDVLTMSFGGNDIGFADVLVDCLVVPDSWLGYIPTTPTVLSNLTGCDISEAELTSRIDALLDPPNRGCDGRRVDGTDGFDCALALEGRRGSIIDFYYDVVTNHLTDRGRLYVVGYPRIFADVNQWPGWVKVACETVPRGDTEKLGRVSEYFNNKLQEAVRRANQALGADRVVFVDRFAMYRDGLHELCGTNEDWLNGILLSRGNGFEIRKETSFHPNAEGHTGVADQLADIIQATLPPESSPAGGEQVLLTPEGLGQLKLGTAFQDNAAAGLVEPNRRNGCDLGGPGETIAPLSIPGVTGWATYWDDRLTSIKIRSGAVVAPDLEVGTTYDTFLRRLGQLYSTTLSRDPELVRLFDAWFATFTNLQTGRTIGLVVNPTTEVVEAAQIPDISTCE